MRFIRDESDLMGWQREFLRGALAPGVSVAVLSVARGNAKSCLCAWLIARAMTPGDPLHQPGAEYVIVSASLKQAKRAVYRFAKATLQASPRADEYRYQDSGERIGIVHKPSGAAVDVISRSGKGAMGLVGVPLVIFDEPGALETKNGELLWDAIKTSTGKRGSPMKVILIGTLAPGGVPGSWWRDLVLGELRDRTYRMVIQGLDGDEWDSWKSLRRANPFAIRDAESRAELLTDRKNARRNARDRAAYMSYRLNLPTRDTETALLTAADWAACAAREPAPRGAEPPIIGIDLGGSRSWSAAVCLWPDTLRVECVAVAPGIPSIREQERRDRVPSRVYEDLAERGLLLVDRGRRVVRPSVLVEAMGAFGAPSLVVCDRFRLAELMDCAAALPIQSRVTRWSEAAADIRDLRQLVLDEGLNVDRPSALLLSASIAQATVESDRSGNVRLVKNSREARDDVAAALLLAAGAVGRLRREPVQEVMTIRAY